MRSVTVVFCTTVRVVYIFITTLFGVGGFAKLSAQRNKRTVSGLGSRAAISVRL